MIRYRPFLNTDLPFISQIWRQQPPLRGQLQEVSQHRVEQFILSKPYFDPAGLIVAVEEEDQSEVLSTINYRVLGYGHASFAPNEKLNDLNFSRGVLSTVKLANKVGDRAEIVADGIVEKCCEYLIEKGATSLSAGSEFPWSPFYLGLYGGSEIPGVLVNDKVFLDSLQRNGFVEQKRVAVFQRGLTDFRPSGGRDQLAVRRKFQINIVVDPKEETWWESCNLGMSTRERFSLYHKQNQKVCGHVMFWDMQPLAGGGDQMARGMYGLTVPEEFRRSGIATFLVSEALKYYMQQGIQFVEAQTVVNETAAIGVFEKLGFSKIDEGLLLSKPL